MTRDGLTVLGRVDLLALDLARPDGISLIAGSENFLVLSLQKQQAAILSPKGDHRGRARGGRQGHPLAQGRQRPELGRDPDGLRQRPRLGLRGVRDQVP